MQRSRLPSGQMFPQLKVVKGPFSVTASVNVAGQQNLSCIYYYLQSNCVNIIGNINRLFNCLSKNIEEGKTKDRSKKFILETVEETEDIKRTVKKTEESQEARGDKCKQEKWAKNSD